MQEIKMKWQGKQLTFQKTFECADYIFCECKDNAAARGFFTRKYIAENEIY